MAEDCEADVTVDSFSGDGRIVFRVKVSDCKNSTGRFTYDYEVTWGTGRVVRSDRRQDFRIIAGDAVLVDESISMGSSETLTRVEVKSSDTECTCLD